MLEKPNKDSVNTSKNNRTLLVGPSFSGKTFLMLEIFSPTPDRDIYTITKSPPKLCSISKIEIKETSDEIEPLNEYENAIIVFDDFLRSWITRYMDRFLIRGRHYNLDINCLSQLYIDLPERTKQNDSNKIFLFNKH